MKPSLVKDRDMGNFPGGGGDQEGKFQFGETPEENQGISVVLDMAEGLKGHKMK